MLEKACGSSGAKALTYSDANHSYLLMTQQITRTPNQVDMGFYIAFFFVS